MRWLGAGLLVLGSACEPAVTRPSEPTSLSTVAGMNQSATVASILPVKIVIRANNAVGPMANVTVTVTPGAESGTIAPASAVTLTDGTAEFTWTLGPKSGTQTLTARAGTRAPVTTTVTASANPGPISAVTTGSEATQLVVVGQPASIRPTVRVTDNFGNPIAAAAVNFQPDQGSSVLTGTAQLTDAEGKATLGSWTIGPDAISYTVRGFILNGNSAVFEARGIPATLTLEEGSGQSANVGTAVPLAPSVKAARPDGSVLPNVPVTFAVTAGGGSVQGASVVTGADGIARPARWILGPAAGTNRVEATTPGRNPVLFEAAGVPGSPASLVASEGTMLSGYFGNFAPGVPELTATDAHGNPVALVPVTFQATSGGGTLSGATGQTDFAGKARPASWRLGSAGIQTVTATSSGFAPISFTASAQPAPASTFRIEVRYAAGTTPTDPQRAAFDAAIQRWTTLIVAGGAPYQVQENAGCGNLIGETVDGVVITVVLRPIQGNILGAAGPCILRDQGYLPVQGYMEFNTNFLPQLEQNGQLGAVILHEMAHVLGFGTIWNYAGLPGQPSNRLLEGSPGADPTFNGPAARGAFYGSMGPGASFTGLPVPVEGLPSGPGTAYSHWRKTVFGNELMTGFLTSGVVTPLSAISVQSFRDLGYLVNDVPADGFTFQSFIQSFGQPEVPIIEGRLPGDILIIDRQGRRVGRLPRL